MVTENETVLTVFFCMNVIKSHLYASNLSVNSSVDFSAHSVVSLLNTAPSSLSIE